MKAYSSDLRERVARAVDQGYKRTDIIKLFGVSRATIKRYLKQRRETGHINRKPIPGRPPKKGAHLQARLVAQLEAYPDATLEMHCQFWEQTQGMRVSTSTLSRVIKRSGWTRKKKTLTATERNEEARSTWREQCIHLDARQIVIMDNLAAHKGKKIEDLIQARGCQLRFLPGYSPDFSPIEEAFSKVKTHLRRVGARTREALQEAIGQALLTVTAQDVQGWFCHCGYLPQEANKQR